jgi:hypothetical protein
MIDENLTWPTAAALAADQATAAPEDTRFWWVEIIDAEEPEAFDEVPE